MNLERMEKNAQVSLAVVSLLGVLIMAAGAAVLISGLADQTNHRDLLGFTLQALVVVGLGAVLAGMPWVLRPVTMLMFRQALDERYRHDQYMGTLESQRQMLESIKEGSGLSDAAKQIAFRAKDREALRLAIKEDIDKQDYEAAAMLLDEMERRFGYRQEAEQLRGQVEQAQRATIERHVKETTAQVDAMTARFDWAGAQREVDRLVRRLPTHPVVRELPERVQAAKDSHKRELLKQWKDAVARDDVDRSVELLRQLDQYLTPGEAEAYKEAARDVFKKKLQQLGVQFALHVHDKNWGEAFRIGKQITDEFPNSRIAAEVRERMVILEGKAHQPAAPAPV